MSISEIVINSSIGIGVTYVGILLISLLRAPKLLDDERAREISTLSAQNMHLSETLAATQNRTRVSASEQKRRDLFQGKIAKFSEKQQEILEHLLHHGTVSRMQLAGAFHLVIADEVIEKAVQLGLVVIGPGVYQYGITPEFRDVFRWWLDEHAE